jgi:hypothetical protein
MKMDTIAAVIQLRNRFLAASNPDFDADPAIGGYLPTADCRLTTYN